VKVTIFGNSSPGDYLLSAVLRNDLATTKFKIMTRWKCCCTKYDNSGLVLI